MIVLGVVNRIYRFAARRLNWHGTNPVSVMLSSERPKPMQSKRRRIFEGAELEQTIAAASEPYRTLFTVAALTGARVSELLGLTWTDVRIADLDDAEIEFAWQVDRRGIRQPTKTDGSARTVPIPRELGVTLARHRLASRFVRPNDYVFSTRTGGPLQQRNVSRALRHAQQRAVDAQGNPTFPILRDVDEYGHPVLVPHGALPSMHSFRHTVASRALLAGESIDEVAFFLGHRDANVTRAVYVRELADARRRTMRTLADDLRVPRAVRVVALDVTLRATRAAVGVRPRIPTAVAHLVPDVGGRTPDRRARACRPGAGRSGRPSRAARSVRGRRPSRIVPADTARSFWIASS